MFRITLTPSTLPVSSIISMSVAGPLRRVTSRIATLGSPAMPGMKEYVLSNPSQVGLFGPDAVVPETNEVADVIEEVSA